ncbi:SUMF1/EgtB/PvdO family nonheme iron enzyme [Polyangium sp. 15x6]|uniref:formylglycine-generating enzyme family protein n=1 Tax=Polyangium sp. 15x6 TaxID=3042687 RepID=UPI00249AAFC6|nr:SUMF1/EgtB/PvdO family nonheme iron enzyme [Polyangium sp. 15x6]MDI3283497.1 SUMF1/EgtB/PvdO family nonheme iron enzyme [Polyangium sp. 15x6]
MRVTVSFLLIACPLVIAAGCFGGGGIDAPPPGPSGSGATGGTGGSGGTGGAGGGASSSSSSGSGGMGGGIPQNACPKVPNTPAMVELESSGTRFCIDSTEVTNAQYKAWLDTNPDPTLETFQPFPQCEFNKSFGAVTSPNDHPVANVDWCDAFAFCAAHEKRLCGAIGGGPTPYANDYDDPTISQWHNACTMGGMRTFPYGKEYVGDACNGANMANGTVPVGSLATCEGGFDHIFDMSGNVWEWEDSCETQMGMGDTDLCHRRGGGFTSGESDLDCSTASMSITRSNTDPRTGFRCCADLPAP